jgi:NAD(P)-dependent dehydrogenase (short-subunit alcohol dehydrogenase family)
MKNPTPRTPTRTIKELMTLDGRVAVITGGAGHIGSTIADTLAELGGAVAIVDSDSANADAVVDRITQRWKVRSKAFAADLERAADLSDLAANIRGHFGRIDILINCAAFVGTSTLEGWAVPFEQQTVETWRRAMDVNLTAPFALAQALAPDLRASGHGSIVNVASIYGLAGPDWRLYEGTNLGNPAAYAASKGGLIQLTRWLATTLAPDIRVNAIAPGGIERNTVEPFLSRYKARTPLGRMGTEEDVKGITAFLASDLSAYVTGQCFAIDGGWTAW